MIYLAVVIGLYLLIAGATWLALFVVTVAAGDRMHAETVWLVLAWPVLWAVVIPALGKGPTVRDPKETL